MVGSTFTAVRRLPVVAFVAVCCLLCGCRAKPVSIAVIPRTTATPLWEPLHQGIVEAARPTGLHVYWNAPSDDGDTEKQMALYSRLQQASYAGFIFVPDETLAARSSVLRTIDRGIPVVIVDDELGPPPSQKLSYVSTDDEAGAALAAARVSEVLHGHGSIAVTGIITKSQSSLSRDDAFEKALARTAPDIHITVRRFGDTVLTHQQQIAQQILLRAAKVDAIVALSSAATRGAYYAKLAAPQPAPLVIVGFDQDLVLPLRTGDVDAVIAQNTREIGRVAMRNLAAQLRGETVPGVTRIAPLLLTRDTLDAPAVAALFEYSIFRWSGQ